MNAHYLFVAAALPHQNNTPRKHNHQTLRYIAPLLMCISSKNSGTTLGASSCGPTNSFNSAVCSLSSCDSCNTQNESVSSQNRDYEGKNSGLWLEKHFEFRDKLLRHLAITKSPKELIAFRQNEQAFRSEILTVFRKGKSTDKHRTRDDEKKEYEQDDEKGTKAKKSCNETEKETCSLKNARFVDRMLESVWFEVHYAFPGLLNLLVYCLAHAAVFDLLSFIASECMKNVDDEDDEDLVYLGVLMIGIVLLRAGGGVWAWTNKEEELEEHEKEFGSRMMLNWFHKHASLKEGLNMLSFYLCFLSVFWFYEQRLAFLFDCRDSFLESLPSAKEGGYTHVSEILSTESPGHLLVARHFAEQAKLDGEESSFASKLLHEDERHLYSHLSFDSYSDIMGDPNGIIWSPTTALTYSFSVSFFAIVLLKRLGMKLDD